jgi:hypothetical protein
MTADIHVPYTIYSATPGAGTWRVDCRLSGLNSAVGTLTWTLTVAGITRGGDSETKSKVAGGTTAQEPIEVVCAAGEAVVITVLSSNAGDTAVTATATAAMSAVNAAQVGGTTQTGADVGAAATLQIYGYRSDAVVLVANGTTDADRGTNLATAYTAAAALTPGGNALSASNRAAVLIPPGHYARTTALAVNTNYVDLIALKPEMGGRRSPTDYDVSDGSTSLSSFHPPCTLIYSTTANIHTVNQSAQIVRMHGFGIAQLSGDGTGTYAGCYVSANDNDGSEYDTMYFWHKAPAYSDSIGLPIRAPVGFAKHVKGIWRNCIANACAWRVGYDVADAGQFSPTMYDCEAGVYSWIGDYVTGHRGTHTATNCRLERCKCVGTSDYLGATNGAGAFGGCGAWGCPIDSSCVFIDCEGGDRCGALGETNAGTWIRFRGGNYCLGAATTSRTNGFSGYAEDCVCGVNSFGSSVYTTKGSMSGTLKRCVSLGSFTALRVSSGIIEDCLLSVAQNNVDCITLLDSNSHVNGSTLLVVEGGTGVAINAASALNVSAVNNRYNNKAASATGLGANVTNTGASTTGVPSALDGGEATLAGMLRKIAGTSFAESTDGLHAAATNLALKATAASQPDIDTINAVKYVRATTYGFGGSLITWATGLPAKVCAWLTAWGGVTTPIAPLQDAEGALKVVDKASGAALATATSVTAISTILSGITSLAKWLRGFYRKDAMDATAKSEVNNGGGTFNEATDSLEGRADTESSSTLTSQNVRDAMKLAPSAGTPAAGSVDKHLDDASLQATSLAIKAVTDAIDTTADHLVVEDWVIKAGRQTIYRGASYTEDHERQITVPYDSTWPTLTGQGTIIELRFVPVVAGTPTETPDLTIIGDVDSGTGDLIFELTEKTESAAAQSYLLAVGVDRYVAEVWAVFDVDDAIPLTEWKVTVREGRKPTATT